jgi:hypothetical protein
LVVEGLQIYLVEVVMGIRVVVVVDFIVVVKEELRKTLLK